ncbi:hypothetical protein GOP47_0026085 [Adiantum capillus-veneris]|uniref:RING-type domain-containing protein n=1 Tax=Adiantum capillus-veneris TaxID=13818 RepID=A0A9D4U192_ADICA|nr:hypothetical protein GOP47_0026085 [Adiantum capillus-veneris]
MEAFTSFLQRLGIISSQNNNLGADPRPALSDDPSTSLLYSNPHLHTPFDRRLHLCHSAFSEAVRASLPVVLYRSFNGELPSSSSPSSSSSRSSSWTTMSSKQVKMQDLDAAAASLHRPLPALSATPSSAMTPSLPSPYNSLSLQPSAISASMSQALNSAQKRNHEQMESPTILSQMELQMSSSSAPPPPQQMEALNNCKEASHNHCTECAICLCEFQGEQEVRELPECRHIFHKDCIDDWILHSHNTCPLCRSSLLTPAVALHEVLQEQLELSLQISNGSSSVQELEEWPYSHDDQALHHHHQHQAFFFI